MSTSTTDATSYRQMAQNYLERPPAPQLAALAIPFYQKAIALEPAHLESYFALALACRELGETEQALACCEQALVQAPTSLVAHFYRAMLQLPMIYRSTAEVARARNTYHQQLEELVEQVRTATIAQLQALAEVIGQVNPFYLQYQDGDDLALMACYGRLISQVMTTCYPQWQVQPVPALRAAGQPIRLGIVSGLFYQHSVWKDVIKGWITQLDPQRFTLLGYSLTKTQDHATAEARASFTATRAGKFYEGQHPLASWVQWIRADQPDILIYPEVSMRKVTTQLAALRLAPCQCTTWANYVTSGLPTIDYFLSGELIEPPAAAVHYSERLVRLPNTSLYYTPLPLTPSAEVTRETLGLRNAAVIYFCGQALFKYLPQYDTLYPQIAQALQRAGIDCQFVFLQSSVSEPASKRFAQRLTTAFVAAGIDKNRHVVLLPRLSDGAYHRLNQLADLFLDSIGVGGATTTLEALAYDLPIITLPGAFLRGHVSAGILRQMGVTATIADSLEHYLSLAIQLGQDATLRSAIRQQMAANKTRFYADPAPIIGLTDFLERVVHKQETV